MQHMVLPEPLSPTKARVAPAATSKWMSCSTALSPIDTETPAQLRATEGGVLEGSTQGLLPFNGFEQRFEVALAKALGALPLDDLEEHRGAVYNGLRKNLQQIAFVIAVDEDAEVAQWRGERTCAKQGRQLARGSSARESAEGARLGARVSPGGALQVLHVVFEAARGRRLGERARDEWKVLTWRTRGCNSRRGASG